MPNPNSHFTACRRWLRSRMAYPLVVILLLLASSSRIYPQTVIQSGCEVDYPPFCIVDEHGKADGFSVELMRASMDAMDHDVTFRTGPWSEVRGWLERGEIDALPLVGRTPEREQLFDFTIPYMSLHGAIVVREDNTTIRFLEDLRGRQVAVMKGDNAEEFLRREDRGIDIVTTPTFEDALQELSQGRYDAVVTQRLVALRLIQEANLTNLQVVNKPVTGFRQDFCFAVKEGDRATLALLNEGLALVMADGTYRHLHTKWFASLQLPSDRPILVGGDRNYPPFEFLNERGRPAGFNVDLTRAIAREMNLDVEIGLGPWTERVAALASGDIDIMQGMFYSTDRDLQFDFTQAHTVNHCIAVVKKGSREAPETIEDLAGLSIAVERGDIMHEFALQGQLGDQVFAVDDQEAALQGVREERFDCALVSRTTALFSVKKQGWSDLELGVRPLLSPSYCYATAPGQNALLAQFSEGLMILETTGEYQEIYEKWLGTYRQPPPTLLVALRYSAYVLVPLIILLAGFLLWSWSLRKQVFRRTEELQESLTRFQFVFEAANVGKSLTEPTGEMNANQAFADYLGYTRKELGKRRWQDITPIEDIPEIEEKIAPLLDGRQDATRFEKRYVRKDGRIVWGDVSLRMRRDDNGHPFHIVTTVVDITEQKRAQERLRAREEFLRAMIACSPVALYSVSREGKVLSWNSSAERVFGWSEEEVIGKPLPIVPEDKQEEYDAYRQEIFDGHSFTGRELIRRRKDGSLFPVSLSVATIRDDKGELVGILAAAEDITERKQDRERIEHLVLVLKALRNVNQLITHEKDRDRLLSQSCQILTETRGYRSAWIGLCNGSGGLNVMAESGIGEDFERVRSLLEGGGKPECCDLAEKSDSIIVMHDTADNCVQCPIARTYRDTAAMARKLTHEGQDYGVLVVALPAAVADDSEEQSLFEELAGDIGFALYMIETEQERERSERTLKAIFDSASDGILVAEIESGRFVLGNNAICTMLGYPEEELTSLTLAEIHPSDDLDFVQELFHRQVRGDIRLAADIPMLRKDGSVFLADVNSTPVELNGRIHLLGVFRDITERKEAELALAESERQLRTFMNNLPGIAYRCLNQSQWPMLLVSRGSTALTGYEAEEFTGGQIEYADVIHPEDREQVWQLVQEALAKNHYFEMEYRVITRDQEEKWVSERGLRVGYSEDGTAILEGLIIDITDRVQAEREKRESLDKYRLMAENTVDAIWQMNMDGVFTYVNPAIKKLLGYTPEEFIGTSLENYCDKANYQRMIKEIELTINALPEFRESIFEAEMIRSDSTKINVEITGKIMLDELGRPLFIHGITRDITARKQVELELRRSEEKYRTIIEQSQDAIYVLCEDRFVMVNESFRTMFAVSDHDLNSATFTLLDLVAPESRDKIERRREKRQAGLHLDPHYEFKGLTKNGDLVDIAASTIAIPYEGQPAVHGFLRDISEQKQLSKELLQAQKLEGIGRLASGVAHDFNNLLMVISGTLDIMGQSLNPDHPLQDDIREVLAASDRAAALTRQLLAFSRSQAHAPKIINLNEIITNLNRMLSRIIGEDIKMTLGLADDLMMVEADPGQMEQILVNLAVNARDAMQQGGELIIRTLNFKRTSGDSLQGRAIDPGDYIALEVKDTGTGMDQETRSQIFEPFFTTKEEGKGTGLGLSTVYGIVKQNGGHIFVESKVGEGTLFRILFPETKSETSEEDGIDESNEYTGGNETILIVEDDVSLNKLLIRMLSRTGYTVYSARSGLEALSMIRDNSLDVDLILTDIVMPNMNGVEMSKEITNILPEVKLIFMSGYSEQVILQSGAIAEDVPFIKKPFRSNEVIKIVRDVLDEEYDDSY